MSLEVWKPITVQYVTHASVMWELETSSTARMDVGDVSCSAVKLF